ncbi:hypothetical protein HYW83_04745 [Candidatus Peregrinibacteria bacterium]|nr:hypothetical protein [Candidatus Peregrinibacteria bacterium]
MKKIVSALLLVTVFISGCNLFKKDPQKTVNDAVGKLAEVKKMSTLVVMSGTIQAPGETPSKVKFSINVSGKTDTSDKDSPKVDTVLKAEADVDGQKASGEVLFRSVDKKMYVKVGTLNMPGEAGAALNTQLASVLNTWWSLPAGSENPIGKFGSEQQELQEAFKTTKFFTNAREAGEEDVQGMKNVKYTVDLDKDALKKFILDAARLTENQVSPEEELAIGDSLKDVEFSGAVWVGDDDYLHRVKGTVAVQPKQGPSSSFEIDYSSWDYGKDVAVSKPSDSKEFNPLMLLPLLGAFGALDGAGGGLPAGDLPPGTPIDNPLGAEQVK